MKKANIAVLVSGGGTNLQALLEAERSGIIQSGRISLVVSNVRGAYALERAKSFCVRGEVISKKELGSQEAFEKALIALFSHCATSSDGRLRRGMCQYG